MTTCNVWKLKLKKGSSVKRKKRIQGFNSMIQRYLSETGNQVGIVKSLV